MPPQIQTSFIPKKPLVESAPTRHARVGIFWVLVIILFIASLVAAGAAFAYQVVLQNSIQASNDSLTRAQAAYDPAAIASIIRLDNRLTQTKILLQNHIAPSAIFSFLETNTLGNVRFTDYAYTIDPNGAATLQLSGEALDFSSVALQSDAFGQSRDLKDVLFSDINVDPATGHIVFKMSATVDSSLILYRNAFTVRPGAPAGTYAPTPSTPASTAPSTPAPSSPTAPKSTPPAPPIPTTPSAPAQTTPTTPTTPAQVTPGTPPPPPPPPIPAH